MPMLKSHESLTAKELSTVLPAYIGNAFILSNASKRLAFTP